MASPLLTEGGKESELVNELKGGKIMNGRGGN
jgi:hypothetical protein